MAYLGHERAIVNTLEGASAVTDVVSTRIYPAHAQQGAAKPYLVFKEIEVKHYEDMVASAGNATSLMQIDGYSDSYTEMLTLREAVRTTLQRLTPGVVTVGGDTIELRGISIVGQRDNHIEPPKVGKGNTTYGFSQDYAVHYLE